MMKKTFSVAFIFLLTFVSLSAFAETTFKKRLLLAHPTTGTIEVIYALHRADLLNLDDIQLTGVYHSNEIYDYQQSQAMLDTISTFQMDLFEIKDTIEANVLFSENPCSATYQELFTQSDGIIFFGGPDIPPSVYGEEMHPKTIVTDPYRHYFEASFLFHLLGGYQNDTYRPLLEDNEDYFILGICLGMQTMNIATGGTLIQDIPDEIYKSSEGKGLKHLECNQVHRNYYRKMPRYKKHKLAGSHFHQIKFKDYLFPNLLQSSETMEPWVNSYHHQAVEKLGKGFNIGATSMDEKIIEAIFHTHYPNVFAVQFHPERSQFYLATKDYRFLPKGSSKPLIDYLNEESKQFHHQFWKAIDHLLQNL